MTISLTLINTVLLFLATLMGAADIVSYDNDTEVKFKWSAATGDVDHYNVYVSTDGEGYILAGITSESTYIVTGSDGHTYKIKVEAVDVAGNVGPMSEESNPVKVSLAASYAAITVLLEGPYESDKTMKTGLAIPPLSPYADAKMVEAVPGNAVDWVFVEIRSDKTTIVREESMFLLSNGNIVGSNGVTSANFYGLPAGDYYIVVRHRNHLAIMSGSPVSFVESGDSSIDLTKKENIYGENGAKELAPGVFGMYAGDGNNDGGVYIEDYFLYRTNQGKEGYEVADYNLDGGVYVEDYLLYKINQGKETAVP